MLPMTNCMPPAGVHERAVRGYTLMSMQCSIVIRAYNEAAHLGRLLEGLVHQGGGPAEVILVDSGSTDTTVQIAEAFGAGVVHIQPNEFTFGRSLNLGIQAASHELVIIASAHVYPVYPDWIERLLKPFESPSVALVYGRQRGTPASKFSEQQIFRQWYPDADILPQASPFCNNANAAIRRSFWQQHPYDETLTGLEDVAWASWAQSQGWLVAYAAHAEVVHVHAETASGVYNRYRREAMAFKRIFPASHFSAYDCLRLTATNILSDLRQARRERVLLPSAASILWFRLAQFWGTYQGYRHSSAVTQELRERFYYPGGPAVHPPAGRDIQPIRYNEAASGTGDGPTERP
jgi:glycosyltransferase involved in cell wall biosynthesis